MVTNRGATTTCPPRRSLIIDQERQNMSKRNENQDMYKASSHRARHWQFLIYPESAPEDWREKLNSMQVCWIASPVHDKDTNKDGTYKKAHIHVLLTYEGQKSYSQVKQVADEVCAVFPDIARDVITQNLSVSIEYLTHDGFTEKVLYDKEKITKSPAFDLDKYVNQSEDYHINITFEIIDYVEDNDITELRDLFNYCRYNNSEWAKAIKRNTIFYNHYLNSKRNKEKEELAEAKPLTTK